MKKTRLLTLSLGGLALLTFASCSPRLKSKAVTMTAQDSVAYSFGVLNSEAFQRVVSSIPGDSLSREQILAGFSDAFLQRKGKISSSQARSIFETYASSLQQKEQAKRTAEADSLLAKNRQREGVKVTESGLQYRVLKATLDARPTPQDTVVVNYVGRLLDGKEFDSSYKRGEPAVFPLSQVIAGWTEGICLMTKGSKYEFVIPAGLAYGDRGAGGVIPPGAPLLFEVELIDIKPHQEAPAREETKSTSPTSAKSTPAKKGSAKRKK